MKTCFSRDRVIILQKHFELRFFFIATFLFPRVETQANVRKTLDIQMNIDIPICAYFTFDL